MVVREPGVDQAWYWLPRLVILLTQMERHCNLRYAKSYHYEWLARNESEAVEARQSAVNTRKQFLIEVV